MIEHGGRKYYLVCDVREITGVPRATLIFWQNKGYLSPKQDYVNPYSGMKDRMYDEDELTKIKLLNTLKNQKGIKKLLGLILRYVKEGKMSKKDFDELVK